MADKPPLVSVIIPVLSLSNYLINECLPALSKQTYKNFEVLVLPNKNSPKDKILTKKYNWLKIIPTNPIFKPSLKRDIGVKKSKGEIIAFIDDDAYPSPFWLENALLSFKTYEVEAVCGPGILPKNSDFLEKLVDEVLKSPFGSGNYTYRFFQKKQRYVDDYPSMNFLIKKGVFLKIGGFNNNYWPGEDSKLCNDLVHRFKGKILYNPDILVYHHRRNNLSGFFKQHSQYGFHRGAFISHGDKNSIRLSYFIPSLLVLYLLYLYVLFFINIVFPQLYNLTIISSIPFISYLFILFLTIIASLKSTHNITISFIVPIIMLLTHVVYGVSFIKGLLTGFFRNKNIYGK